MRWIVLFAALAVGALAVVFSMPDPSPPRHAVRAPSDAGELPTACKAVVKSEPVYDRAAADRALPTLQANPSDAAAADLLRVVARAGSVADTGALLAILRRTPFLRRARVVDTILSLHRKDSEAPLLDLLAVSLPPKGYGAIALVCKRGMNPAIAQRLAALLKDAPPHTHAALIAGLGRCGVAEHEGTMVASLKTSSPRSDLRRACYLALGKLQTPTGAKELLRGFDSDPQSASVLARALNQVSPTVLKEAQDDWDSIGPRGREALLRAPSASLQPLAVRALADPGSAVRVAAARAVQSRSAAPQLLARMPLETDRRVRRALLDALRRVGTRDTAQASLGYVDELPRERRPIYQRAFRRQLAVAAPKHKKPH